MWMGGLKPGCAPRSAERMGPRARRDGTRAPSNAARFQRGGEHVWLPPLQAHFGGVQRVPPAWLAACATGSFTVALSIALWCLLGLAQLTGAAAYLRHAATICTAVMGGLITSLINDALATGRDDSLLWRVAYALAILDICTLLAAGVMMRMGRVRRLSGAEVPPITTASVRCPRCNHAHPATIGESVCKGCSLVIQIDFRDDLCPGCGYDMRGTPATTCAECGRVRQMPHFTAC